MSSSSVPASIEVSARFERKNREVRAYYENYKECEDNLRIKINELALIVHEENPDWSLNKIASFIWVVNQDLDGFSKRTVYNKVTDENRIILDVKKPKRIRALPNQLLEELRQQKNKQVPPSDEDAEKLRNNVIEEKFAHVQTFVPKESSITNEDEEQQDDDQEVVYDDPQKIMKNYEDTIFKQNEAYKEQERKYEQVIIPFEAKGSVIAPNDQEIPIIGKADPYKKTISFEIDQKEVKKLRRF